MTHTATAHGKKMRSESKHILGSLIKNCFISAILAVLFASGLMVSAQTDGGFAPQKSDIAPKADENLRSIARINPSSLAMEMSVPLMAYPGRGGNSVPVSISYSSKLWQMNSAFTWWYPYGNGQTRYVTDTNAQFAEHSAAGWTSSLLPPRLDSKIETYNVFGKPYGDSLDAGEHNSNFYSALEAISNSATPSISPLQVYCKKDNGHEFCLLWGVYWKQDSGSYGAEDPTVHTPTPNYIYYVKRLRVIMPDGSSHEFRQNDNVNYCGEVQTGCTQNYDGTYLSTGGSAMRLEYDEDGESTLYLPNGGKYVFPAQAQSFNGHFANQFTDSDGNKVTFTEQIDATTGKFLHKVKDTLGREITDAIPHNWETQTQTAGVQPLNFPGFNGGTQNYQITWANLKPVGCETSTSTSCVGENNVTGGALEDQTQKLYYETRFFCKGNLRDDLLTNPNDFNDPINEVLFPASELGIRPCTGFNVQRDSNGDAIRDDDGIPILYAPRFNPVVMSEITLPNGKKYVFKYNRYGEITKITYPTGSYETFLYGKITPMSYSKNTYDQINRGVTEHKIYNADGVLQQKIKYSVEANYVFGSTNYKITTIASKGDNANAEGAKSERYLYIPPTSDTKFGFSNIKSGMPYEERSYDENGVLRSRTLTEYVSKDYTHSSYGYTAERDARVKRSVSVMIEGTKALATLCEPIYDDNGSTDAAHFSHLNVKQSKSYHYKSISVSNAQTADLATIAGMFSSDTPATLSETDYVYNADYKARGIASLPTETRAIDPTNTSNILGKKQIFYDNQIPSVLTSYPYSTENYTVSTATDSTYDCSNNSTPKICWQNPNSAFLGRATTSRVWNKDTDTWIESHTKYDIFGNAVKVKDAIGNEASTVFTGTYKYAYPEQVVTPAPDPTNMTGTNQESKVSMTYDFVTGLPLRVKDWKDLTTTADDLVTATEYNDSLLRPTRTVADNFTAPESQIIYDDDPASVDGDPISVKMRKQIDATNWDEAETFLDSFGRTMKIQTKDSQGDIFINIEYDLLGRVKRTSNPYRISDIIYWSKPRYDELGREIENYAPAVDGQTGESLGITSYAISDVTNFVGTVIIATDASGRKSRSLTNALGQLLRVDEATATGGAETTDLGSLESPHQSTFYSYSQQGKMVKVQQGGQNRYFLYDSLGRLIRVRQPEQEVNTNLNLTDTITGNNQWTAGFAYDVLGNVLTTTDAKGTTITNTYDKASRIITRTYSGEIGITTPTVNYKYDGKGLDSPQSPNYAKGALTYVNNTISQTRYLTFDSLGRLTSSEQKTPVEAETIATAPARVSVYEYNLSGALVKETYPSGRIVHNDFGTDGALSRIYGKANENATERTYANSFSYTPDGKIDKLKLGNGLWESAKFNSRLQVTELSLGIGVNDSSRWKMQYEYGELNADGSVDTIKNTGNIAKQTLSFSGLQNPFVQTFKYDSLYRLIEATEKNGITQTWKQNFGYDRFGNRINFTNEISGQVQTNTNLTHPSVDSNTNRFNLNQGYIYDKNGNLTNDPTNGGRIFIYNGDNKQTEVKDASSNSIGKYYYDGEGKRVKKETNSEITVFVYSNGKLVAEYSTQIISQSDRTTSYTMTDQLDSPRVITNALGEVISRRDFMPFGEEIYAGIGNRSENFKYIQIGEDNIRKRFASYERDIETMLDFAEARYYNNQHGRFTIVDPLYSSIVLEIPQTWHKYSYALNNPLTLTDPTGLQVTSSKKEEKETPPEDLPAREYENPIDCFECWEHWTFDGERFLTDEQFNVFANDVRNWLSRNLITYKGFDYRNFDFATLSDRDVVGLYDMVVADIKAGSFDFAKPENVPFGVNATSKDVSEILRKSNLGRDPSKNGSRWNGLKSKYEAQTAVKLERKLGRQLVRDESGNGDWIDKAGKVYDAVGSDLTSKYFGNGKRFLASIRSHLVNKTNVDFVVVDIAKLSNSQKRTVTNWINRLPNNLKDRIILFKK